MTSKERARLRGLASTENTVIQIGKSGITDAVIASVDTALTARELIKGKVLESSMLTAREACEQLAEAVGNGYSVKMGLTQNIVENHEYAGEDGYSYVTVTFGVAASGED